VRHRRAKTCAKSVYNPFLDEVARTRAPGPGRSNVCPSLGSVATESCGDKPLVWTLCGEAPMGEVRSFRHRKGGHIVVCGFGGRHPTDERISQENAVRQIVVSNFRIRRAKIRHEAA
jgi:hypothetical protein